MADTYAGDLTVRIKADVDEKSVDNATRKIANNSKIALQKEVKDMDNIVTKSLQALRSDVQQMDSTSLSDVFTRASEAVKIFNNRVAEIEKMDSIDSVTAKLYKFEQKLNESAKAVLNVKSEFEDLQKQQASKDILTKQYGGIEEAKEYIREIRKEAESLTTFIGTHGPASGKFDTGAKNQMIELSQEIDNVRNKLAELKAERDKLSKESPTGMSKEIESLDKEIVQTTSRLGNLSRQFYSIGKEAGLGKNKADIKEIFDAWTRMEKLYNEANNLRAAIRDIETRSGSVGDVMSKLANVTANFDEATEKLYKMDEALNKVENDVGNVGNAAQGASASFNDWRVVGFSLFRVLGSINTVASDVARAARRIVNFFKQIYNAAKKVASAFKSIGQSIRGTADGHAQSLKKMLKDIIRYSLGIRSLFMLFRRLRKYIKEAFTEMAKQIPEVNTMLASLKSSLYGLKGSLATAFEPILSAIAPALVRLIDLLAQAVTYIGMFFAALTGRGFVYKANKVAQTIGKAAGNAKELNKQLQGFDELNNLTTNNGSGGGGDTPLAQFEKVDVPKWIENLANMLKKIWNDFLDPIRDAWAKVGDYVVDAWRRAFVSVRTLLSDILRDFLRAWKSGLGESIATNFFKIVGDVGHIIANIADALRKAWEYNDNGYKIWVAILKIVDAVLAGVQRITDDIKEWTASINLTPAMTAFREWLESLVPIVELIMDVLYDIWHDALKPILNWAFDGENSGIAIFFRILRDFNDGLDKSKIRENLDAIWQAIGRFGQTIGEGLLIFMNKMSGYLKDWLNSDEFTKWCESVRDFLDSIEPADLAEDLEQIVRIIRNVAEWVGKVIKLVWEHKDDILDILEYASEHLDTIAKILLGGKLITDLGRLIINLMVFFGALGNVGGGLSSLLGEGGLLSGLGQTIGNAFNTASLEAELSGAGSLAAQIFMGDFTANIAAGGLVAATTLVSALVGGIASAIGGYALGNKLGEWLFPDDAELYEQYAGFEGFARMMVDLWDAIKYSAGEAGKAIADAFSKAGEWIKDKWAGISEWFHINVAQPLSMMFSDAWQAIKRTWQGVKTFFQPVAEFLVNVWEGATERISELFEGCWIVIQAIWKVVSDWFNTHVVQPLKTIWNTAIAEIQAIWTFAVQVIEQLWTSFVTFVKQLLTTWYNWINSNIIQPLKKLWNDVCTAITTFWNNSVAKIKSIWNAGVTWFKTTIIAPLQNAFNVMCNAIKGFFEGLWASVKNGAKTAVNWVLSKVESAVNGMIDSINGFFGLFNHVVSWASNIVHADWGGVKPIGHVSIPKLAQGAVIPPNNEFLAVLGDQKRGTNIESPLSTMVEAFNQANKGGNEQELALLQEQNDLLRQLLQKEFGISENAIYRSVRNQDRTFYKSTGRSGFAY